ncbi:MAG TPA: DUF2905 domain-containing protein [Thermoanaerobaculia bacterium]|nr:DUF2905 domain-containing protein [Thermoanaerobaculia bacterium]
MGSIARILIITGIVLIAAGLAFALLGRLGIGRLPGDIVFRRGNFTLYVPLMTSIFLSILLTLALWFFRR